MKKSLLLFLLAVSVKNICLAQTGGNGIFIAESGSVKEADAKIYTYLRFYKDSMVYLQAVNALDPVSVNKWFGRRKQFSQRGRYHIKGDSLYFETDNKSSEDYKLEGLQTTTYKGKITSTNKICLYRDNETNLVCFDFYPVNDTTRQKYSSYKADIKLPGNWWVKQVLQGSKQVFFTNDDSTEVGIAVLPANKLSFYKPDQTVFESTTAYYEWDANYMRDEEKMKVTKIAENKEKSFIIWRAKDDNNDNYYLFARNKEFLYNIMIFDEVMALEKKLQLLEAIFDMNK